MTATKTVADKKRTVISKWEIKVHLSVVEKSGHRDTIAVAVAVADAVFF